MVNTPDEQQPAWKGWLLVVLALLCSALSYIDRNVISLVVQPLKASMGLSDGQIGVVNGLAFSLAYGVAQLPFAFLIDRGNRARVAACVVAVWSFATGACGLATGFASLLTARIATATAEAGFSPAVLSMLGDRFPRERLARATTAYLLGPPLGSGLALIIGGALLSYFTTHGALSLPVLGQLEVWQSVFLALVAPGVLLAIAFAVLVQEPARRQIHVVTSATAEVASHDSLLRALRESGSLLIPYCLGATLIMGINFSFGAWIPTFFIREYGTEAHLIGPTLGKIYIASAVSATILAGLIAGSGTPQTALRRAVWVALTGALLAVPAAIALPLAGSYQASLFLYGIAAFSCGLVACLATVPTQMSVPNRVRGKAIVTGGLTLAVLGGGAMPWIVGTLTDMSGNERALGQSLSTVAAVAGVLGILLLTLALRATRRAHD